MTPARRLWRSIAQDGQTRPQPDRRRWVAGDAERIRAITGPRLRRHGQDPARTPRPGQASRNHHHRGMPGLSTVVHRFEDVLARTRFGVPQRFFVPGIPDLLRDSESVLSGYFSLSSSAPHLFGDRLVDFAGEVRALLANRSAKGIFWDWPGDTEVVMSRKPG